MSPHSIMPLLVGREASIKAIESAVNNYGKRICLVTQREPELEKPNPAESLCHWRGRAGAPIYAAARRPDQGALRGPVPHRLAAPDARRSGKPVRKGCLPQGRGHAAAIIRNDGPETEALVRATKEILAEYAHTNKKLTPEILSAVTALRDPGQLADTILPLLKIEYPKKQEALELSDPGQRLERFTSS